MSQIKKNIYINNYHNLYLFECILCVIHLKTSAGRICPVDCSLRNANLGRSSIRGHHKKNTTRKKHIVKIPFKKKLKSILLFGV